LEALEFKSCKFKASKVLENEGGPSLDYFLQIKVDYFVNLAECGVVVYWNIFQNLRSCPRKVLEKVLESP